MDSRMRLGDLPVFSLTVASIELPIRGTPLFVCQNVLGADSTDGNGTARHTIRIEFRPSDTPVPRPVRRTAEVVAMSSTLISSVLTNPTTAMIQARSSALMTLSICQFSHTEPLDTADSPFGWSVGQKSGGYYRGAIVGSSFLLLLCICAVGITTWFFYDPRRPNRDLWGALGVIHAPGVLMVVVSQLIQSNAMVADRKSVV